MRKNDNKDDSFFRPKDIVKRNKKKKEKEDIFRNKIIDGLKKINETYKNKKWKTREEKSFLKVFLQMELNDQWVDEYNRFYLMIDDVLLLCFNIEGNYVFVTSGLSNILNKFNKKGAYYQANYLMKIVDKYFDMSDFTIC